MKCFVKVASSVSLALVCTSKLKQRSKLPLLSGCRPTLEVWSWFRPERITRRCAFPWWSSPPPSPTTFRAPTSASALTPLSTQLPPSVIKQKQDSGKTNSLIHFFVIICSSADLRQNQAVCSWDEAPRLHCGDDGRILRLLGHHGWSGRWC